MQKVKNHSDGQLVLVRSIRVVIDSLCAAHWRLALFNPDSYEVEQIRHNFDPGDTVALILDSKPAQPMTEQQMAWAKENNITCYAHRFFKVLTEKGEVLHVSSENLVEFPRLDSREAQ